jgi:hypothetical protein
VPAACPLVAGYTGAGGTDDAANFACSAGFQFQTVGRSPFDGAGAKA